MRKTYRKIIYEVCVTDPKVLKAFDEGEFGVFRDTLTVKVLDKSDVVRYNADLSGGLWSFKPGELRRRVANV